LPCFTLQHLQTLALSLQGCLHGSHRVTLLSQQAEQLFFTLPHACSVL